MGFPIAMFDDWTVWVSTVKTDALEEIHALARSLPRIKAQLYREMQFGVPGAEPADLLPLTSTKASLRFSAQSVQPGIRSNPFLPGFQQPFEISAESGAQWKPKADARVSHSFSHWPLVTSTHLYPSPDPWCEREMRSTISAVNRCVRQ